MTGVAVVMFIRVLWSGPIVLPRGAFRNTPAVVIVASDLTAPPTFSRRQQIAVLVSIILMLC